MVESKEEGFPLILVILCILRLESIVELEFEYFFLWCESCESIDRTQMATTLGWPISVSLTDC